MQGVTVETRPVTEDCHKRAHVLIPSLHKDPTPFLLAIAVCFGLVGGIPIDGGIILLLQVCDQR